jgi:hypothetical protein
MTYVQSYMYSCRYSFYSFTFVVLVLDLEDTAPLFPPVERPRNPSLSSHHHSGTIATTRPMAFGSVDDAVGQHLSWTDAVADAAVSNHALSATMSDISDPVRPLASVLACADDVLPSRTCSKSGESA